MTVGPALVDHEIRTAVIAVFVYEVDSQTNKQLHACNKC